MYIILAFLGYCNNPINKGAYKYQKFISQNSGIC